MVSAFFLLSTLVVCFMRNLLSSTTHTFIKKTLLLTSFAKGSYSLTKIWHTYLPVCMFIFSVISNIICILVFSYYNCQFWQLFTHKWFDIIPPLHCVSFLPDPKLLGQHPRFYLFICSIYIVAHFTFMTQIPVLPLCIMYFLCCKGPALFFFLFSKSKCNRMNSIISTNGFFSPSFATTTRKTLFFFLFQKFRIEK